MEEQLATTEELPQRSRCGCLAKHAHPYESEDGSDSWKVILCHRCKATWAFAYDEHAAEGDLEPGSEEDHVITDEIPMPEPLPHMVGSNGVGVWNRVKGWFGR